MMDIVRRSDLSLYSALYGTTVYEMMKWSRSNCFSFITVDTEVKL